MCTYFSKKINSALFGGKFAPLHAGHFVCSSIMQRCMHACILIYYTMGMYAIYRKLFDFDFQIN